MQYKGTVKEIKDSKAVVSVKCGQNMEACTKCGLCSGEGIEKHKKNSFTVTVPVNESFKEGDMVTVDLSIPNEAASAFLMFGIPLIFMLAAAIISLSVHPGNEGLSIISGLSGFGVGFIVSFITANSMPYFRIQGKIIQRSV